MLFNKIKKEESIVTLCPKEFGTTMHITKLDFNETLKGVILKEGMTEIITKNKKNNFEHEFEYDFLNYLMVYKIEPKKIAIVNNKTKFLFLEEHPDSEKYELNNTIEESKKKDSLNNASFLYEQGIYSESLDMVNRLIRKINSKTEKIQAFRLIIFNLYALNESKAQIKKILDELIYYVDNLDWSEDYIYLWICSILRDLNNYEKALHYIEKVKSRGWPEYYLEKGQIFIEMNQPDKALLIYIEGEQNCPYNNEELNKRIKILKKK